jgi:DNA processing protein
MRERRLPADPVPLAPDDPAYPARLADLADPPARLFVRGRLVATRAVAVVGARAATPYGRAQAHRLARDLAALGITIVSGLARGIDAAAHRGALDGAGSTVAVLPGGLAPVTPLHHEALAAEIADHGALASEHPAGTDVHPGMFLRRNRLIAALGEATVVVEAAERSGALDTAAWARRMGRPVLAVPGDVDREQSRGCLALLRAGARPCADAQDVLAAVPALASGASATARVLQALAAEPRDLESLARAGSLGPGETLAALLELEWSGLAAALPGQRWRRVAGP